MIVAACATLFFLWLHAIVARATPGQAFHDQFKLSRGFGSLCLTAIGFFALWHWWPQWTQAFLARHTRDSLAFYLVCFVSGHFIADFLLLGWAAWRRGSAPRRDLVAHHLLGLVVCGIVFYYQFGYALFAVALTTEMMPVTSGIAALAPMLRRPALERLATQLRLLVLLAWRLPFWSVMMGIVLSRMLQGEPDALIALGQRVTIAAMTVVAGLDLYWTRLCLRSLRGPMGRA